MLNLGILHMSVNATLKQYYMHAQIQNANDPSVIHLFISVHATDVATLPTFNPTKYWHQATPTAQEVFFLVQEGRSEISISYHIVH